MIQRYSEDDGLDTMSVDDAGNWVPYSDYKRVYDLYMELVAEINAIQVPVSDEQQSGGIPPGVHETLTRDQ